MIGLISLFEMVATRGGNPAIVTDADGRTLWVNESFTAMSGFTLDDVLGKRPGAVLQGLDTDRTTVHRVRDALNRGESVCAELLNYRKDGSQYWVEINVTALRNAEGTLTGFLSNQVDITARVKAEQRLTEAAAEVDLSNRRLSAVLNNTFQLIGLLTPNGVVLEANRTSLEFIGVTVDDVVQRLFWETAWWTHDPVQQQRLRDGIVRAARGEFVRFETTHPMLDGRLETLDFSLKPVRDPAGQVEFIVHEGRPISEQRAAAEILSKERGRLSAIIEGTRAGTWEWNVQTGETVFNERWAEIIGYTLEELAPASIETWATHAHPEDLKLSGLVLEQHFAGIRPYYDVECRMRHKDGSWIWVQDRGKVVDWTSDGRPLLMSGTHLDITERRALELQATRTQRLQAIGTLVGGIAHDLNNALAPILMCLDLLRDETPSASDLVDTLESGARRAAQMVRQLLTFAKGAAGDLRPLAAAPLLTEVATMIRGTFPKSITVAVDATDGEPTLHGDSTQLHQVLVNLCVNARDAMPAGGTVHLSVRASSYVSAPTGGMPAEHARPGRYVVFEVRDEGTGIAPDILDRIFDPFFTTKAPESGTGLGLSTVLGIVKGHDGFLTVDATEGRGTSFRIHIPAATSSVAPTAPEPAALAFHDAPVVIVVDDEPAIREAARRVLQHLKCIPVVCANAEECYQAVEEIGYRLRVVFTDLHMPGTNGLELATAIRAKAPMLPIIVMSGLFDDDVVASLDAIGHVTCLSKPFTQGEIADVLRAAINGHPAPVSGAM